MGLIKGIFVNFISNIKGCGVAGGGASSSAEHLHLKKKRGKKELSFDE